MVQQRRQTPLGFMSTSAPCGRCGGKGRIIHQPCKACHGSGQLRRRKTLKVTIPAGIDNGQTISLRGQGNAGRNGGPAGDLLIVIAVRPHEIFRRDGARESTPGLGFGAVGLIHRPVPDGRQQPTVCSEITEE